MSSDKDSKKNILNEVLVKYYNNNDMYYIGIFDKDNKEKWYKYEIICSHNNDNNEILWAKDMIIIPKKIKSNINDSKNININLEDYLNKNNKYLKIVIDKREKYNIYLGLTKIIKS
jgi:hypothetical protein